MYLACPSCTLNISVWGWIKKGELFGAAESIPYSDEAAKTRRWMDVGLKDFNRALHESRLNEVSQTEGRTEWEVEQRLGLKSIISSSA